MTQATTAYVQFRFDCYNTSVNVWYDGIQVEKSSTASASSPFTNVNGVTWNDIGPSRSLYAASNYTYPTWSSNGYFSFTNNGTVQNNIYASTQNISTSGQTQYTRIGWFYLTGTNGAWSPVIQNSIGNNADMALVVSSGKLAFHQYTNSITSGTASQDYTVSGSNTVNTNTWYQGAITVNRSTNTLNIYLNGVLDTSTTINVIGNSNSDTIIVGGAATDSYSGDRMFKGYISQVFHYNTVLTASQILQNFNAHRGRYGV